MLQTNHSDGFRMTNKNDITVIFDMGNVLLLFDHMIICRQVAQAYNLEPEFVLQKVIREGIEREFELGNFTEEQFTKKCSEVLGVTLDLPVFRDAWSYMFTENVPVIALLHELQGRVRLFLMSNTNIWHIEHIRRDYSIMELFDDVILSYEIGSVKPQPAIYQRARELSSGSRLTVFIDDMERNAYAAYEVGIHGIHYRTAEELRTELAELGIPVVGKVLKNVGYE